MAQIAGSDNFNDNSKDTAKWGTDVVSGGASLVEANARLEYRVTTPNTGGYEDTERPWIFNTAGNSDAFNVILDVTNTLSPTGFDNASLGIAVTSLENPNDRIFIELARGDPNPANFGRGFLAVLDTNVINAEGDNEVLPRTEPTSHPLVTTGSVRLSYDPASKVFTAYYDTDGSGNGYQWQVYGSFGVAGSGGSTRNGTWLMTQNLGFQVSITAYSEGLVVNSGQVYADNFSATPAVDVLGVVKTRLYDQTDAVSVTASGFEMSGFISGSNFTSTFPSANNRFVAPGKSPQSLVFEVGDWFSQINVYPTQTAMDTEFPNGTYSFLVGTSPSISLPLNGDSYPTVPVVTASAGSWSGGKLLITPQQAAAGFTLTSNISNGDGFLTMEMFSNTQDVFYEVIDVNTGTPVIASVPPGSLVTGDTYEVQTEFDEVVSSTSIGSQTWAAPTAEGFGLYSSRTIILVHVLTPLEQWRLQNFGTIANTGSTSDSGDQDGDGLSNLLEWAAGLSPTSGSTFTSPTALVASNIEFTYQRSVAALNAGASYFVEWSDSLETNSWSTASVSQQVLSDNGTLQQVKATLPAGANGKRFVRLRVTSPP